MDIELALGLQGYDVAMRKPKLTLTDESTDADIAKHKIWHSKNRLALLLMKRTIIETIRGSCHESKDALEYMQLIYEKY